MCFKTPFSLLYNKDNDIFTIENNTKIFKCNKYKAVKNRDISDITFNNIPYI